MIINLQRRFAPTRPVSSGFGGRFHRNTQLERNVRRRVVKAAATATSEPCFMRRSPSFGHSRADDSKTCEGPSLSSRFDGRTRLASAFGKQWNRSRFLRHGQLERNVRRRVVKAAATATSEPCFMRRSPSLASAVSMAGPGWPAFGKQWNRSCSPPWAVSPHLKNGFSSGESVSSS